MGEKTTQLPGLRELLKENIQKLYDFVYFMSVTEEAREETLLEITRNFGDESRRILKHKRGQWEDAELRLQLFKEAWRCISGSQAITFPWSVGRDTRTQRSAEIDLLTKAGKNGMDPEQREEFVLRLSRVDSDLRAPVVLKDLLSFGDEEVCRILNLRWGVYRHRLHRGRIELCEKLRGKPFVFLGTPVTVGPRMS